MKLPWYLREQGISMAAFIAALSLAMSVFAQSSITVKGVLLAQDGTVQGGARIIFTTSGSTQKMIEYPIAASGTFNVSLVLGMRYNVRVVAPGYPLQYFDTVSPDTTDDGPPPLPILFSDGDSFTVHLSIRPKSVSPIYGMLRGTVYDSTGAPLPFARVTAMVPGRDVTAEVETDATGQFLCKAPAQPHYIACTWYPYPTQFWSSNGTTLSPVSQGMVVVSAIDTVRVTIKMVMNPQGSAPVDTTRNITNPIGGVSGKVLSKSSGQPLAAIVVSAFSLDSASSPLINSGGFNPLYIYTPYSDTSKPDGSYSIKGMPKGTYIIFTKSTNFLTQYYYNADSVKAAKRMLIDSVMVSQIDFTLRTGASISGKVVTKQGKMLSGVGVNATSAMGGFSVNTMTDTLGAFTLSGLAAGRYCINVTGANYSPAMDTNQCTYTVTDGAALTGIALIVDQAGIITGPYPAPIRQDSMNAVNQTGFEIALFSDTLTSKDSMLYETRSVWANVFSTFSATTQRWQFVANQVPVGKWRLLLRGAPQSAMPTSAPFIQTRGFSFGTAATLSGQTPVTITGGDTALLTTVNFPTGYSVFGRITLEKAERPTGCTVTAFVKEGNLFIPVSRSYPSTDSGFELPGLVDGLDYFIRIDAPNYPSQFWSPTESSVRPVNPWHFSTSSFVAAQVRAVQSPKGMIIAPPQLWAWFTVSDTGGMQLQCNTSASMPLDSIVLYGKVGSGATVALASFPYIPTQYSYTWKETGKVTPGTSLSYVFVGKGPALTLRSNSMYYSAADTIKIPVDSVRLTLIPTRTGVQISWRQDSLASKTGVDTALLYRKADKDTGFVMYKKAGGTQKDFFDGSWDKTKDLGKSVYYQVQVVENNAVVRKSAIVSFTATQSFINQMANVLSVGPSMKYGSIQQAVDAAQEFDIVAVEPGVYNENITLRGKVVTLQGNWTNGKAPVISGNGGAAITAPYTSKSVDRDVISVNGFKIQNSLTGIASSAAININQCLFTGIQKEAVQLTVDSAAIAAAELSDPLAQSYLNCSAWQCTFIGKGTGSMALRAYSATAAAPIDSLSQNKNVSTAGGHIGANNCIFAYYASTYAPADAKGVSVNIDLQTCDFWQASKAPTSTQVMVGVNPQSIDPMFIDTVDYFLSDSSKLKAISNVNGYYGYDGRRGFSGKNQDEPTIPAVTNFKASITGQRQVTLSWSPLPDTVKIDGYVVFRVLGYDSLFHVNSSSQWEPIISDTAMFSILDTFRTRSTVFIDNTPVLGVPYLYAVAGISVTGTTGKVNLPYPPALSAYILKIDPPAFVPWLAATAVGFSAVNLQWKRPLSAKSIAPAYTLCRITGGQNLVVASQDSSAVRTLVRQGAQSASPAQIFSTPDTSFYDSTTVVGPAYLYVVSVADSALAFGERPLTWAVVSLDSARYYPQRSIKLAAGQWAMIGPWGMGAMPFSDTSSALFSWDDAKKSDKLYSQYATVNSLRSCAGYWINAGKDTVIGITDSMYGGVIRHRDSISVSLVKGQTGWNQIASPFPFAVAPRWLGDTGFTVYAWKPDSSQYVEQSQLLPWQACWVHIDRDTQLVFRASDAVRPGARVHKGKHMSQAAWELKISLSGKSNDPDNFIGIVAKNHAKVRLASLKPPQAFDYPQLYVLDSVGSTGDRAQSGQKLSKLYKISNASPQTKLEWMIGISPASSAMKVKITGATATPDKVYLFWVTASSAVNLKEQPEIDISAHKEPVYGYVVATTNLRDIGLYSNRVELRRGYPNPFRSSATLEFTIPYAWNADGSKKEGETRDLSLMLFNVNGQRISTLLSGMVSVGQHRLVWNGRTDAARPVAPGIIIARLSGSDFQKTMKMFKVR